MIIDSGPLDLEKQAMLLQALHGLNSLANDSKIGKTFSTIDFGKFLAHSAFVKHDPVTNRLVPKTHLHEGLGIIPYSEGFRGTIRKGVDMYNNLPSPIKGKVDKFNKNWDKATMGQIGIMATDFGATMAFEKGPKNLANTPPATGGLRQQTFEKNNQSNFQKNSSSVEFRKALPSEITEVLSKLKQFPKEFQLTSINAYKLALKNLITQDTFVAREDGVLKAFINGGYRGLPLYAPDGYYIRFVWVSDDAKGQGLAGRLIEKLVAIKKVNLSNHLWTQVDTDNKAMQKMVTKLGFKHVTTWNFDNNKQNQIWVKL